jgi:hypothetical protein
MFTKQFYRIYEIALANGTETAALFIIGQDV